MAWLSWRTKHYCSLLIAALISFSAGAAKPTQENDTVILVMNDWSSQIVLTHITAGILNHVGYKTVLSTKDSNVQWGLIGRGMGHVQMEVWQGTMETTFNRLVKSGALVDAGLHDAYTREEWWYPLYVEEFCPGLPDWRALKKCAHIFSSNENANKGFYLGGPWEKPDEARIRALGLKFKVEKVTHADELWPKLALAHKTKTPIVLFNWTPNWVEAQYDGKFVEFPDYHPDCEFVPEWGENKDFLHDCGNPKRGWLKKAVWGELPQTWPCAFEIIKNVNFNNTMLSELALKVDSKGKFHQQAANEWLADNKTLWQRWVPEHCVLYGET